MSIPSLHEHTFDPTEDEDFLAIREVLVFTDPRVPQCVCVSPLQDSIVEGDETFVINILSVLDGVSSGASRAEVTILDDDGMYNYLLEDSHAS